MFEEIKQKELNKIENRLITLNNEIGKLSQEQDNLVRPSDDVFDSFSWIEKNITKRNRYKKEYQEWNNKSEEYYESSRKLSAELTILRNELVSCKNKKEKIENANNLVEMGLSTIADYKEYCMTNNVQDNISVILDNYSEEAGTNLDFMINAVDDNPFNIRYDLTNNIELYKRALTNLSNRKEEYEIDDVKCSVFDDIISYLNNPSFIEDENNSRFIYYLLENIRLIDDNGTLLPVSVERAHELFNSSFGQELDKIYSNPDYIIGAHGVHSLKSSDAKNESYLRDGIKTSNQDEYSVNTLCRTVLTGVSFLRFLTYADDLTVYYVTLPKTYLSDKENTPIWGGNSEDPRQDYLLPQYMYGGVDKTLDNPTFFKYDGPKTEYKYLYVDESKRPYNEDVKKL